MSPAEPWPSAAFLDALRPESEWTVDMALVATYSADMVSLAAALLALAGRDDEAGDGNPADLADALELLRGKVLFIIQEGRLAAMRRRAAISVVLDSFVKSVRCNEEDSSWHPKFAVLRYNTPRGKVWRIWLGSRNLTVASNLDFGLTLDGREGAGDGATIPGVDRAVAILGTNAGLSRAKVRSLASACGKVLWSPPKGLSVIGLHMLAPTDGGVDLPHFADADEVVLISPFLDGTFVADAARWAKKSGAQRYVVSTLAELRKLAHQEGKPLTAFKDNLLVLESPTCEETSPEPSLKDGGQEDEVQRDEELIIRGLHAKLIAVRHGTAWQMWVGSANATTRAWGGGNFELVALLEGKALIDNGLRALLGTCKTVTMTSLLEAPPAIEDPVETALERGRKRISANFQGHLARSGDAIQLVSEAPFPTPLAPIRVQVGLMTGPLTDWPAGAGTVPLGKFDIADQTSLVQWRLFAGEIECRWLQCLEVRPAIPKDRDHAAIAARMTPNQFLTWIRQLLSGEPDDVGGGGSWRSAGEATPAALPIRITLEEVLGSRARQHSRVSDLDARLTTYLKHVMRRCADKPDFHTQLQEFADLWDLARKELLRP